MYIVQAIALANVVGRQLVPKKAKHVAPVFVAINTAPKTTPNNANVVPTRIAQPVVQHAQQAVPVELAVLKTVQ